MTLPSAIRGYVDDTVPMHGNYGDLIDAVVELVPDLMFPNSVATYSRMRTDPKLAQVLKVYTLPIRRAQWVLNPDGCRDEVARHVAADLGIAVKGDSATPNGARRSTVQWDEIVRLSLLDLVFGFMPFERAYEVRGGRYHINEVSERMPQSVSSIYVDRQGRLLGIDQNQAPATGRGPQIDMRTLVWFAHEREGAAWQGQSLLRPAYVPYLLKHETMRVHATSIRRFGMGVPTVTAPQGAQTNEIAFAQRLSEQIRAGERSGVGLPNGYGYTLTGLVGSVPNAVEFLQFLDGQIASSTLLDVLSLGQTTGGNRALGEVFLELLFSAIQSIGNTHAAQATAQLVIPLVNANWGEDEPAPRIECGPVNADEEATAEALAALIDSGAIDADAPLKDYLRARYRLPARDPNFVPPVPAPAANPFGGTA